MIKYKCEKCGNTEEFLATYRIYGTCIVNGRGVELSGVGEGVYEHVEIDSPYKCVKCGNTNISGWSLKIKGRIEDEITC